MMTFAEGPWLTVVMFGVLLLAVFHRQVGWLVRMGLRAGLGLGALAVWAEVGVPSLALGVNLFNAAVLGVLGLPGLGLLFLARLIGT